MWILLTCANLLILNFNTCVATMKTNIEETEKLKKIHHIGKMLIMLQHKALKFYTV